jgi:hypothetical protein
MKKLASLFFAATALAACGSPQTRANEPTKLQRLREELAPRGTLSIAKQSGGGSCRLLITFRNDTKDFPISPRIDLIIYDTQDNTLGKDTTFFDPILAGKSQMKSTLVSSDCSRVGRVYVSRAQVNHLREIWSIKELEFTSIVPKSTN